MACTIYLLRLRQRDRRRSDAQHTLSAAARSAKTKSSKLSDGLRFRDVSSLAFGSIWFSRILVEQITHTTDSPGHHSGRPIGRPAVMSVSYQ